MTRRMLFAVLLIAIATPLRAADMRADLRFWLENMIWHHGYSAEEAAAGLQMPIDEVRKSMAELGVTPETKPPEKREAIKVLPWAPGRHPRIGFLEGALDPQRDTKISIWPPWEGAGYVVYDLPEAVFSNLGLLYLAHTHVPTVWSKAGVQLPQIDWTRNADGTLRMSRKLPNDISFGAKVWPRKNAVDFEYWLENGTKEMLTGLRNQLCLLLKNAPDFNTQTGENKLLMDLDGIGAAAVRSKDGKHWIVVACKRAKCWQNPPCPCIHADPTFPDCAPGQRVKVRGRIFFFEGEDIRAEVERRRAEGLLFGKD